MLLSQRTQVKCFQCAKLGHLSLQCPTRTTLTVFQRRQFTKRPPQNPLRNIQVETMENKDCKENKLTDRVLDLKQKTRLSYLEDKVAEHIWKGIASYHDIFHLEGDPLPCTNLVEHEIILKSGKVINTKSYRPSECHAKEIHNQIEELYKKRVIGDSNSHYNSPFWVVPKKKDAPGKQKWRIVIDFRKINEDTEQDAYPLPVIHDILDHLGNAKFFSVFDLGSRFHQIPMAEESKKYTGFSTPDGHFEFNRMLFGLKNAPATFQHKMDGALKGHNGKFIKKFSALAKPLIELTKKENIFDWTKDCQKAFDTLKQKLCKAPVLRYLNYTKVFLLTTDASNQVLGAVLSQDGHPCCHISHTLNSAEQNYSTSGNELLAIVWATKCLRQYLLGRHFKIQTDHQALVWLHNVKDSLSRLLKWRLRSGERRTKLPIVYLDYFSFTTPRYKQNMKNPIC